MLVGKHRPEGIGGFALQDAVAPSDPGAASADDGDYSFVETLLGIGIHRGVDLMLAQRKLLAKDNPPFSINPPAHSAKDRLGPAQLEILPAKGRATSLIVEGFRSMLHKVPCYLSDGLGLDAGDLFGPFGGVVVVENMFFVLLKAVDIGGDELFVVELFGYGYMR